MQDIFTSVVRTFVPSLIGAVVAYLTQKGVHVPPEAVAQATALITLVVGTGYYIVVRALEKRYPQAGLLLGVPKPPTY
jgi:uncharacterized membrane protein